MPRTKQSKPSYDPQSLLNRTETMETEFGMMRFYASDGQRGEESLDQDSHGNSALAQMLGSLEPGDTVYDVGCRSGLHSLAFAKAVGPTGKVMCFEHDLLQLFMAHMNLTDHGLEACVQFLPIVASDQLGLRRYNRFDLENNDLDPGNGINDLSGSGQCIAMPLDQLGEHKSPQLIRIGPIGLELAALKGMQRLILDAQPRLFVSPESPHSHDEITLYLSQIGYDVYGFSPRFKDKRGSKSTLDGASLDPQDFNLYCVLPRVHRAPSRLPLLMKAQTTNFRSQLAVAEDRDTYAPYFEVNLDADNSKDVANTHFAYWAWQSLRNELRTFVRTFLQSALGQLSPETYGELTRQAVEFISSETPAGEYESLRSLLFQAMKSIRRAVDLGRQKSEELGTFEEKLTIQASELSRLSYQLTQANINRGNSDIELERVQLEKENLHAQTMQLQQSLLELTSQLLSAKENEAKSLENLAASNARGSAELMSISKAHKQEIAHLESKMASMEGEKADLHARTEQLIENLSKAIDTKAQEALAAQTLANEQASQIRDLTENLSKTIDTKAQEALDAQTLANEQASQIRDLTENLSKTIDTKAQEALDAQTLAKEQASQIEQLGLKLIEMQEHETLVLQSQKELDERLQQKEAELERAKAGFDAEVKRLMDDQTRIILRGRVAEDKITDLNRALEAEIQAKASIQSLCSELDGRIGKLTAELSTLRERETDLVQEQETLVLQARKELDDALRQKEAEFESAKAGFDFEVGKLLQDQNEVILRGRTAEDKITDLSKALEAEIQEKTSIQSLCSELDGRISELTAELLTLKQHYSAHVPPQQYQALVLQTEELRKRIEAVNSALEARDIMVSDLTDLVRLQAAQLEHRPH